MDGPRGSLGPSFAEPSVAPADFARALEGRSALVLAPSDERGWFGGRAAVAWEPTELSAELDVIGAGEALGLAFDAEHAGLCAALLSYEGGATVACFAGALVHADEGWCAWGEIPSDAARVAQVAAEIHAEGRRIATPAEPLVLAASWDLPGREFRAGVEQVRERIASGDVYVLNLTARIEGSPAFSAVETFSELVARAGSEMSAAFVGLPGQTSHAVSVSPERFVRIRRNTSGERSIEVCPVKGTAPRGGSVQADLALAGALAANPKERAEHVMVVDLERNDIGVVCVPATVVVDPLYEVVTTPYCHQLVSTVRGVLRAETSVPEVLVATFPCGSVTGAPKRSAMRIAAELERTPRGVYCGALMVAVPGEIDSSVLIRTLELKESGDAVWGTGCGITFDSDPAAEYLEALLKATPVTGDGAPLMALRETMCVVCGDVPLLDRHLARLAAGGCGPTLLAKVRSAVAVALAQVEPNGGTGKGRLGVTVTPDGSVSALVTHEPSSLEVVGGPRIAAIVVERLPELPRQAAKPAARAYWDRAHRAARMRGADQAVLVTEEGTLIDGSTATLWLVSEGVLATPPAPPAVAGVMRELVFDLADARGITAEERPLTLLDLDGAEEVCLSNAVGGVVGVRGREGALTRQMGFAVEAVFSAGKG